MRERWSKQGIHSLGGRWMTKRKMIVCSGRGGMQRRQRGRMAGRQRQQGRVGTRHTGSTRAVLRPRCGQNVVVWSEEGLQVSRLERLLAWREREVQLGSGQGLPVQKRKLLPSRSGGESDGADAARQGEAVLEREAKHAPATAASRAKPSGMETVEAQAVLAKSLFLDVGVLRRSRPALSELLDVEEPSTPAA